MNTDQDIEELKRSQHALETKLKALIERSPALRSVKIERLRARARELLVKVAVLHEMHKKNRSSCSYPVAFIRSPLWIAGKWK
jgi:hypothetical protein